MLPINRQLRMATDAYNGGDLMIRHINAQLCPPLYSTGRQFISRFRLETVLADSHMLVKCVASCMVHL
jgi:hypothetical protein